MKIKAMFKWFLHPKKSVAMQITFAIQPSMSGCILSFFLKKKLDEIRCKTQWDYYGFPWRTAPAHPPCTGSGVVLWRNWFDLASPWQPKISLLNLQPPCLQSLCRCSKKKKKQLDTTSDVCSPVITPVCSFWRLIHTLVGFCGSYVIKQMSWPSIRY